MQAKLVSFGVGALTGLGTAIAYFRVNNGSSQKEHETQNEDVLEQQLFKYALILQASGLALFFLRKPHTTQSRVAGLHTIVKG